MPCAVPGAGTAPVQRPPENRSEEESGHNRPGEPLGGSPPTAAFVAAASSQPPLTQGPGFPEKDKQDGEHQALVQDESTHQNSGRHCQICQVKGKCGLSKSDPPEPTRMGDGLPYLCKGLKF
ncbi:hypothetical protein P7K49_007956 [Saguinus oedipus]|uniref:Uncharacterized protein n=1 Tax=Saguinus oedipus TaxID=9490 RepID=A0ABQ9VWC9_SAGOE|nr:hypothetical protein P7K49_007956 [Saguinus oedipus]